MLLPIEAYREEIIETVRHNRVTIINGETGSGKTTQVPRYLYEAGLAANGCIGVTEPRRIAAISTSEFVANQIGCRVGEEIGFQIRFNDTTCAGTKVKFMTGGILLQEAKSDPLFSEYQILVCDEAHERTVDTDINIGLAKRAMAQRDDLRLVIMSATLQEEKFTKLFPEAVAIHIEGRMFPVDTRYLTEQEMTEARYSFGPERGQEIEAYAAYTVDKISRLSLPGDILIFMPGEAEIHRVINLIESLNIEGLNLMPCYGNMSPDEQKKIFKNFPGRKVVVATNIAETSITIDGIVHVVDSGHVKENYFDPKTGITMLKTVEHSKSGLEQRKGRAGRTQAGICWRLFKAENYEEVRYEFRRTWDETDRPEFTTPEIQRSEISGVILRLIGIGIKNVEQFDFIDAPEPAIIASALKTLVAIGALTESREIKEIGEKIMDLPLDPKLARIILAAEDYGIVIEIIAIAAMLSVRSFFSRPKDEEFEADIAKKRFSDLRSDLLTGLAVMAAYEKSGRDRNWAKTNFLNWKAIEEALSIKNQLEEILTGLGIPLTSCGYGLPKNQACLTPEEKSQGELIGKAVTAAFIQNLGIRHGKSYQKADGGYTEYYIHPSSVLPFHEEIPLVVATSIAETTKTFGRNCQKVEMEWLKEIAPDKFEIRRSGPHRSYFADRYEVTESVYFAGTLVSEMTYPVKGPETEASFSEFRPSVFTRAAQRILPVIFGHPMDDETRQRIDVIQRRISLILREPEIYGYAGGFGITRKTYILAQKIEQMKRAFDWDESDKAKQLLAELEEEVTRAFERADAILKKRAKKAETDALERETANREEKAREKLENEWAVYQERLAVLKAQVSEYPGFGIYTFPVVNGFPRDYQEDGKVFSFDEDYFEVLPEETAPRWGYVTQWGKPNKIVLLLKVMEKPKHLS